MAHCKGKNYTGVNLQKFTLAKITAWSDIIVVWYSIIVVWYSYTLTKFSNLCSIYGLYNGLY